MLIASPLLVLVQELSAQQAAGVVGDRPQPLFRGVIVRLVRAVPGCRGGLRAAIRPGLFTLFTGDVVRLRPRRLLPLLFVSRALVGPGAFTGLGCRRVAAPFRDFGCALGIATVVVAVRYVFQGCGSKWRILTNTTNMRPAPMAERMKSRGRRGVYQRGWRRWGVTRNREPREE